MKSKSNLTYELRPVQRPFKSGTKYLVRTGNKLRSVMSVMILQEGDWVPDDGACSEDYVITQGVVVAEIVESKYNESKQSGKESKSCAEADSSRNYSGKSRLRQDNHPDRRIEVREGTEGIDQTVSAAEEDLGRTKEEFRSREDLSDFLL